MRWSALSALLFIRSSRKILSYSWYYYASKVEAIYLHNRIYIAYNRKGMTAFAVFCLSLFVGIKDKPISGVGCRSPPFNLDFSKNSDWR